MAVETQSGEKLCFLVTDNGKLCSNEMACWCAERGITQHFTALHTSAQNGRIERLHRTLMNKARAMRLLCNALLSMWNEFILTASYLSTLTTSKATNGQTPYELWFGVCPSLSHLSEIGCHAYVFTSGTNPKIAAKSVECVLIGYASNAKAFRCWHWGSGRIVDSFHVTFVEHLNDQSWPLLPGQDANTVLGMGKSVTAPTPTSSSVDESMALPLLDDIVTPSVPDSVEVDKLPR